MQKRSTLPRQSMTQLFTARVSDRLRTKKLHSQVQLLYIQCKKLFAKSLLQFKLGKDGILGAVRKFLKNYLGNIPASMNLFFVING